MIIVILLKAMRVSLTPLDHFVREFHRDVVADSSMFFSAPDDLVAGYRHEVATRPRKKRSPELAWDLLLSGPDRVRTKQQSSIARSGLCRETGVAMLDQYADFESIGTVMPCLTQSCIPWSYDAARPLLPVEALAAHGFPAWAALEDVSGVKRLFEPSKFSSSILMSFAGNGQSVQVIGVCTLWICGVHSAAERARAGRLHPAIIEGFDLRH